MNKNRWKNYGFYWFFRFRASKNPPQIDAKTHSKKTSKKNLQKIDFGFFLGLPEPPEIPPNSFEILLESDVERSLFRDAMEIANKSSEGIGTHGL